MKQYLRPNPLHLYRTAYRMFHFTSGIAIRSIEQSSCAQLKLLVYPIESHSTPMLVLVTATVSSTLLRPGSCNEVAPLHIVSRNSLALEHLSTEEHHSVGAVVVSAHTAARSSPERNRRQISSSAGPHAPEGQPFLHSTAASSSWARHATIASSLAPLHASPQCLISWSVASQSCSFSTSSAA